MSTSGRPDRPDRPGGSAPHVGVPDLGVPELEPEDRHHLERVRRLRAGDALSITDGRGSWRWCRFGVQLEPDGEIQRDPAPEPGITVAFAVVKGGRPELIVQKLTEIGVDRIVPFVAERSIVRWDGGKVDRQTARLRRVAREAAMQCRRTWWPQIDELAQFQQVIALPGAAAADRGGGPPTLATPSVIIGPEGGWSDAERDVLPALVGLGPNVLRAETAAISAAVVLVGLRSGVVRSL